MCTLTAAASNRQRQSAYLYKALKKTTTTNRVNCVRLDVSWMLRYYRGRGVSKQPIHYSMRCVQKEQRLNTAQIEAHVSYARARCCAGCTETGGISWHVSANLTKHSIAYLRHEARTFTGIPKQQKCREDFKVWTWSLYRNQDRREVMKLLPLEV